MGDMPIWKGLFEWSMRYQDGTGESSAQRALPEEERRWLETALKSYMVDLGKRMKDIKDSLDGDETRPATVQEKEQLLDELMELVEGIDQAKDLHTIGGLPTLLDLLHSEHPSLRWRAAEVVATCVQNNPAVQEWFMEGGVLPLLERLLSDSDATCQTKGLLAVSCLVRGYHPALLAFRDHGGIGTLCTLLQHSDCVRLQRKCLQLLQYMVRTIPGDRLAVAQAGVVAGVRGALAGDDNDLRQVAATLANELAGDDRALALLQQDSALREEVQRLQMRLDTMPEEDWDMVQEEVAALKLLTQQLDRQLPPPPSEAPTTTTAPSPSPTVVLVDNPDTSGAPPSQLQLATLPPSE